MNINQNTGVTEAKGFSASGVYCGLKQKGLDVALVWSDRPAVCAGVFTTNAFKAAPVVYDREILARGGSVRAVVLNAGNANACTGIRGSRDVSDTCAEAASLLSVQPHEVLAASTGIIGVPMPMDKLLDGVRKAAACLSPDGGRDASEAIITTDTCAKRVSASFRQGGVTVTIGGMSKGAGMINPDMATTLTVITTDANIGRPALQRALGSAAETSFNALTVDGDMSTNDTCLVLANGAAGAPEIEYDTPEYCAFEKALGEVMTGLARLLAADGEGATKYMEITVKGAATVSDARRAAKAIGNSPLVKTAVFGEDPNWGRVLCAAGYSGARVDPSAASLWFGDILIVKNGEPVPGADARPALKNKEVFITLDLGIGSGEAVCFSCDFSYDYVKINGEYHT
ncbi:MAG: bifunctional glutamate N-acetyltransferase/amino-acid acetyltransferase ArgJ [Abditibacteriota bacterium]|nr:bifunctional glutamate N-acetyltransferase/amino-acid acetyltransferase ArgJ [Abditibacteriota bacterium]